MKRLFAIALVPVLALLSCQKDDLRGTCMEPRNVSLRIQCRQRIDSALTDTALRSPVLLPVGGNGVVRYSSPTAILKTFPSPLADSCYYLIRPDSLSAVADTLFLRYWRQLHFISDACGFTHYFELKTAQTTHNFIDSVQISNPLVDNNANSTPHLRIFIRRS